MDHRRIAVAFSLAAGLPLAASAAPAHTHGQAELRIAVDGGRLEIQLDTPLDSLVGFERAPRTDAERQAVRAAAGKLRAAGLFVPTSAANCTAAPVKLASAALPPDLLGEQAPAQRNGKPAEHADLEASFAFACANPSELKGVETMLLRSFPGIRKVAVEIAGPRGQSRSVLTPGKSAIAWQPPK